MVGFWNNLHQICSYSKDWKGSKPEPRKSIALNGLNLQVNQSQEKP
jgi:hypothetical protein